MATEMKMNWIMMLLEMAAEIPEAITEIKAVASKANSVGKLAAASEALSGASTLAAPLLNKTQAPIAEAVEQIATGVINAASAPAPSIPVVQE